MDSQEIRETFLAFFEGQGHLRRPSASLVPAAHDASVLLTTAGMQPLKPYFLGVEEPPSARLTSSQRCFRTTDIEQVGTTARHLTYFEMLGNFSLGDYFKDEAIAFGWELSTHGFGFDPEQIWVTVFEGDEELSLGPDTEAIEIWSSLGVPEDRIVRLPRSENFWQGGATGPSGPCSEMYVDRGLGFGGAEDLPGDDTERFLEYWNHVFMSYELHEDGSLTDLPSRNIDTGLGLERMAAIKQGVESVYETDLFRPLVALAEELSGHSYGSDEKTTRAMRILADHSRGMTQLISDGVVPSNEDRGYILRRIMRRAIQQGRVIGLTPPYMERFAERAIETMSAVYPRLEAEHDSILGWIRGEEQGFGRTLDRGTELLRKVVATAHSAGRSSVDAAEAFELHDTYGFPYEMTKELLADEGLAVDDAGFEVLMDAQRERARVGSATSVPAGENAVFEFISAAPPTRFVGFEELRTESAVAAAGQLESAEGQDALVKLEESPFYATGGGQVADTGELRWDGKVVPVTDVYRVGEDQALRVALDQTGGSMIDLPEPGERVEAVVATPERRATMRNHTATHLLHAALRDQLGAHVRQAGSAVRPDKLRFDFTHGEPLSADEVTAIEDTVNGWIKQGPPVRALHMDRAEAERLGAMALFGEKYGDWVRVVEVEGVSRELCGGTHVASAAEIGIFAILTEGSSAANVRRIEAITGPAGIDWFRERSAALDEAAALLGASGDAVGGARRAIARLEELEQASTEAGRESAGERAQELIGVGSVIAGVKVVIGRGDGADQNDLLELADRIKGNAEQAAVVLGGVEEGRVGLVASFSEGAVAAGLDANEVVQEAAGIISGGGGGRANVARAGGGDPEKLDQALATARRAVERVLGG